MPNPNDKDSIKITLEDLASVIVQEPTVISPVSSASGAKSYGTINEAAEQMAPVSEERGSILLQGWFYLGIAGLLGALAGWALAEPGFVDGGAPPRWGNLLMIPILLTFIALGFAISESIVERSVKKAVLRGALALPLGFFLGFVFDIIAGLIYNMGLRLCYEAGIQSTRNPVIWLNRGIAWMIFGAVGGVVYGIVGQSSKKGKYGVIGGMIGAGLGGIVFDPIAAVTHGGAVSRAIGFAMVGIATGVGMGLVESALKDRWLYVTAGPLAGKQFILYKSKTRIGSSQDSDIYLFKDPNILPRHAVIDITGARVQLRATGAVYWGGQSVQSRVLQDGDLVQVGRYSFRYKEKHRS